MFSNDLIPESIRADELLLTGTVDRQLQEYRLQLVCGSRPGKIKVSCQRTRPVAGLLYQKRDILTGRDLRVGARSGGFFYCAPVYGLGEVMMRSVAATAFLFRTVLRRRRSTCKHYVRIFLGAQLVLIAATLAGCGNQNFSEARPSLTTVKAPRLRVFSAAAARPKIRRHLAPTFDDGATSQASPDQTNNAAAVVIPDTEETTGSIRADASVGLAPPTDPRTVRAMNCRDLMLKQHPTVRFGSNGTATAQREYFDSCMRHAATLP